MDANLLIRNFKQQIIETINESQLPAGATLFVLKDILNELKTVYENACLESERKEKKHGQSVHNVPVGEQTISTNATGEEQA